MLNVRWLAAATVLFLVGFASQGYADFSTATPMDPVLRKHELRFDDHKLAQCAVPERCFDSQGRWNGRCVCDGCARSAGFCEARPVD